jgi:hypothetical protein
LASCDSQPPSSPCSPLDPLTVWLFLKQGDISPIAAWHPPVCPSGLCLKVIFSGKSLLTPYLKLQASISPAPPSYPIHLHNQHPTCSTAPCHGVLVMSLNETISFTGWGVGFVLFYFIPWVWNHIQHVEGAQ